MKAAPFLCEKISRHGEACHGVPSRQAEAAGEANRVVISLKRNECDATAKRSVLAEPPLFGKRQK